MAEKIQVRIGGKEPKYFPESEGRRQALFVDVAENRRVFDQEAKKWVDGDPRWYEAKFEGRDADLIRDQFQQGDALLLFGEKEQRVRETADGKTYRTTRFYVENFGIDPRLTSFQIDRSRRQSQSQGPVQTVEQGVSQDADSAPAADADPDPVVRDRYETEIYERLRNVVGGKYLSPEGASEAMEAWLQQSEPDRARAHLVAALGAHGQNETVVRYVGSVAEEFAGEGTAVSWNAAARSATSSTEAPASEQRPVDAQMSAESETSVEAKQTMDPWASVNQIRQDLAQPQASGPSM